MALKQNMQISSIKDCLLYPLYALYSVKFYFKVLFNMSGVGFIYLFILCSCVALPASLRVQETLAHFEQMQLPKLIGQIPPSYVTTTGTLEAQTKIDDYVVIKNKEGIPTIVYNPLDKTLPNELLTVPIIMSGSSLLLKSSETGSYTQIPWLTIFPGGSNFDPYLSSTTAQTVLESSLLSILGLIALWFFFVLSMTTLIVGLLAKALNTVVMKVNMPYKATMRLIAFACTPLAILMMLQFYLSISLPIYIMALVPLMYNMMFMHSLRRFLDEQRKKMPNGDEVTNFVISENDVNTVDKNVADDTVNSATNKDNDKKNGDGMFTP